MNLTFRAASAPSSAALAGFPRTEAGVPALEPGQLRCRQIDPRALGEADRLAWVALEARALEPNPNASPHFVVAALRHLDPDERVTVHVVERVYGNGSVKFIGVALSHWRCADRFFAVRHLASYQNRHTFLGHWLLDRLEAETAAAALLRAVRELHRGAPALLLPNSPVDGPQWPVMQAAARRLGLRAQAVGEKLRAVLVPAEGGVDSLKAQMKKQYANVERCRRRLEELGTLDWRCHRERLPDDAVENFLVVEHAGWKRESGTSLRSCAADEAFFRDMTAGFASEGRALFTELKLDGRVIASTCNYVSGDAGFAFKVGWDEQYRKFGLGIFNEAELVRQSRELCGDLRYIDSGSQPASFIEMLWPARRRVALVVVPLTLRGRLVWQAQQQLRRLLARWRTVRAAAPCDA